MLGSTRNNKLISIITLVGSYLIFVGAFILAIVLIAFFLFLNDININLPLNYNPLLLLISYLPFGCWLLFTGIGIIFKRSWARYSLVIFSYFSIFIGFVFFVTFYFLPLQEGVRYFKIFKSIFLAIIVLFFILLPFWFLIFFTSKEVKNIFIQKKELSISAKRPAGVNLIILWTFLNSLFFLFCSFFSFIETPVYGNIFFSRFGIKILCLSLALINFYIAKNLLKLKKSGWLGCVIYNTLNAMHKVLGLIVAREEFFFESIFFALEAPTKATLFYYRFFNLISLSISLLILIYIGSRRKIFYKRQAVSN